MLTSSPVCLQNSWTSNPAFITSIFFCLFVFPIEMISEKWIKQSLAFNYFILFFSLAALGHFGCLSPVTKYLVFAQEQSHVRKDECACA